MASSAGTRVKLDLNDTDFLADLFALDRNDKIQVLKQFEKISKLTWVQVYQDAGLKWEKIDPAT
jgi:hypothetical protein